MGSLKEILKYESQLTLQTCQYSICLRKNVGPASIINGEILPQTKKSNYKTWLIKNNKMNFQKW